MILGGENDFSWIHYKYSTNIKIEIKVKKRDELNWKKNTNDNQQNVFQQALAGYVYRWNTKSDNNNNGLVGKICKVPM